MDGIFDFFSPEAGQARRRRLGELGADAMYYVPPELRGLLGLLAEANPVSGVGRAGQAAQELVAPGVAPLDRVGAGGRMLSEMAGVAAPAMVASRAAMPAAQAIQEGLLSFSAGAQDVGRAVVDRLNQPGPMPTVYSNPIVRAAAAPEDFDFVGYRTVEAGTDPLAPSRVWEDDKPTGEYLPGVSVTDVNYPAAKSMHGMAAPNYREGLYFGDETYMIGGNKAVRGEDPGEFVISDPVIIKQLIRKYGIAAAAAMLGMSQADLAQAMEQQPQPQGLLE